VFRVIVRDFIGHHKDACIQVIIYQSMVKLHEWDCQSSLTASSKGEMYCQQILHHLAGLCPNISLTLAANFSFSENMTINHCQYYDQQLETYITWSENLMVTKYYQSVIEFDNIVHYRVILCQWRGSHIQSNDVVIVSGFKKDNKMVHNWST